MNTHDSTLPKILIAQASIPKRRSISYALLPPWRPLRTHKSLPHCRGKVRMGVNRTLTPVIPASERESKACPVLRYGDVLSQHNVALQTGDFRFPFSRE